MGGRPSKLPSESQPLPPTGAREQSTLDRTSATTSPRSRSEIRPSRSGRTIETLLPSVARLDTSWTYSTQPSRQASERTERIPPSPFFHDPSALVPYF